MELADLRKRVKILDGNTGRNELLTRLHEREEENKRAEQQLRILNDKFHQVHKGLVHIDEEREKLRIAKDQLEKEKKEIQRQLDIREKEVLLLARRCSSQEEKMRESAKLRVSNNELASEMEGLRTSLTMREEEISQIDSLKRELKECQDSRQGLLDRLNKVKKDHNDVVETLNSCFQNIQKLNQSNAELEEERKREMQRAQLELEQQRLSHLDIVNELRAEVQLRQDRIEQMEAILKENMTVCTSLRKERGEWNTKLQLELSKMKEEHATERSTLNSENDRLVQKLHDEYAIVLDEMRSKLEEKDGVVSSLEDEVSKYMKKIMALSTDLQNLREETSRAAAVQTEAIAELDTLTDLVCTRDEEIAKLSATITTLENEKESLSSELMDLRDRIKELEEENAFIMDLEDQLHDVNTSMIEVNEKKSLEREEYEMTVALLQQELDDERSMWASMEQGLHDKISALEEKNQKAKQVADEALSEARQVLRSASTLSTTEEALRCSLKEVSWERETRQALEEDLKSLQLSLVESQNERVEERKGIEKLEAELANVRETSDHVASSSEERVSLLQEELSNMRELHEFKDQALESVQTELRDVRSANKQEVSTLQEELKESRNEASALRSQLSKARISVGAEATASQRILAEKDASIASLTSEIAVLKSEAAVQDRMLQNIESKYEKELLKLMEDLEASRLALEHEKSERVKMSMANADALDAANTEITEGKEIICQQTTQIACLEVKLSEIQSSVEEQAATSGRSLASKEKELASLQAGYDKLKCETLQMENEIREQLESKEQELAYVYAQLKESSERIGQLEKSSETTFKEKDEEINALTAELENSCSALNQMKVAYRHESKQQGSTIESLQEQLREALEESKQLKASNKASLHERDVTIANLAKEISEAKTIFKQQILESNNALTSCQKSFALLKTELEQGRLDDDNSRTMAAKIIEQKDTAIKSLRSELEEVRKTLSVEKQNSIAILQAKEASTLSLQSQISQVRLDSEREKASLRKEASEKKDEIALLRSEIDDLTRTKESDAALYEKRIEAKDNLIASLKNDLDDLHSRAEEDGKSCREQIARLKIELQKVSTNLAIRDDEIRDLKLIDLKEAEEAIESLESQLASARQDFVNQEAEATGSIAKLQSQLVELKSANNHLQQKNVEMCQQHSEALASLSVEKVTLKQAKEAIEVHAGDLSAKLEERHSTITVLTRKNTLLEQRERTLQSQLKSLAEDVRHANEEKDKALMALDLEINRQLTNRQDDDINFQRRFSALQVELEDTKTKLAAQNERTTEVERQLEDRTKLLGDMVTSNKEVEDEKEKALALIIDLQEAVDRFEEENEAIKKELVEVRELQRKREDQLLETIHDERHLKEIAEADLEVAQSKLRSMKHDNRDVNELEKENRSLKDKVRRQEGYLKRKLQKEKVLRDRNTRNVMATPTPAKRIPSPSKRRAIPASVGVKTTASMSVMSEGSSFPDEWDAASYRS